MIPHLERRLARLEAASGPQNGLPSVIFQQFVNGDRREPSDAEIERQIADAIASGRARDRDDITLIQLVAVHPKPQPDRSLSPRIVIPDVLPVEPEGCVHDAHTFGDLNDETPEPDPARPDRSEDLARIRRRMRSGMLSDVTAGEMFLGQHRPER